MDKLVERSKEHFWMREAWRHLRALPQKLMAMAKRLSPIWRVCGEKLNTCWAGNRRSAGSNLILILIGFKFASSLGVPQPAMHPRLPR